MGFADSRSVTEAVPVFTRIEECLHHLGGHEVSIELIQFAQPEVIAAEVEVLLGRIVRVTPEVTKVLHQDKRFVQLLLLEGCVLSNTPYDARSCGSVSGRGSPRAKLSD